MKEYPLMRITTNQSLAEGNVLFDSLLEIDQAMSKFLRTECTERPELMQRLEYVIK